MAVKRYELSDEQWSKIAWLLPGKIGDPGRTGSDNRLFINGCLWFKLRGVLARSAERYGKWKAVHKRFSRWCHARYMGAVFETLTADRDNRYLMIDSTIVRAHQQAATGKGGQRIRRWGDMVQVNVDPA